MRPFASVWAARHHLVYVLTILLRNGNLRWHVFERSYRVSVLWSYLHPQGLITMSFVSTPSLFLLTRGEREAILVFRGLGDMSVAFLVPPEHK